MYLNVMHSVSVQVLDYHLYVCIGSISESKLWLDAITQNAWDTGKYI